MPVPKSVTRTNRDGVKFTSNVDRTKYLLKELERAALRDTAKIIRKIMVKKLRKLPDMQRSKRITRSTQSWVRKQETDLQIGFRHDTWYGVNQELGLLNQPKRQILRSTVMENIDDIRRVQGKYLSAIESENTTMGLIDENGDAIYGEDGDVE